jgi:hypothetical protein
MYMRRSFVKRNLLPWLALLCSISLLCIEGKLGASYVHGPMLFFRAYCFLILEF